MPYLDANAAERLRPAARAAMDRAAEAGGNPYSVHGAGRAARRILEEARERLAGWTGRAPADLVFASGGTEANALAIHALSPGRRLAFAATEHDAVRDAASGGHVLPVDSDGVLDLQALRAWLAAPGPPALVCVMAANNETGTLQPVAAAYELCRAHGALLHCDAVAAAGRVPFPPADSLAVSSGKFGGPQGAGFVAFAPGLQGPALFGGGGQERGRRGGTPSLPAIAGMAAAIPDGPAEQALLRDLALLRDEAAAAAVACGAVALAARAPRLANTACLALPGVPAATQVIALDLAGVAVSAGAACSSGKVARSHVLEAMGAGSLAGEAIRVSLPWDATRADVDGFARAYRAMAARLLARAAA